MGGFNTLSKRTRKHLSEKAVNVDYVSENEIVNQDLSLHDAILIEYNPHITSLVKRLKAGTTSGNTLPSLILTGLFQTSVMAIAMQLGFDEYLAKPVGSSEIMALIKKANQNTNK